MRIDSDNRTALSESSRQIAVVDAELRKQKLVLGLRIRSLSVSLIKCTEWFA